MQKYKDITNIFFQKSPKSLKRGEFTEISKIVKKGNATKTRMECIFLNYPFLK